MTWNGRYFVTSFRSLVHDAQIRIENALDATVNLILLVHSDFIFVMNFQKKILSESTAIKTYSDAILDADKNKC